PPEAHPQSVPVGKRTALKVPEKVGPRRAGIRATCRSRSAAASAVPEGGGPVRYHLGVDWADQTHAVWVVDERGTKITARTVPHTAEGLSEWGRELDEWRAHGIELWAAIERPEGRVVDFLLDHGIVVYPVNPKAYWPRAPGAAELTTGLAQAFLEACPRPAAVAALAERQWPRWARAHRLSATRTRELWEVLQRPQLPVPAHVVRAKARLMRSF